MAYPLYDQVGRFITPTAVAQPDRTETRYIVIHHAAWTYDLGDALQSIFGYHSSRWPHYGRIGYHEVIQRERDGTLRRYQVNAAAMVGAGVWGRNETCYHICAATRFDGMPDADWLAALAQAAAEARQRYPQAEIVGHTDITLPGHGTACPGPLWASWRPLLLDAVGRLRGAADGWTRWGTRYPLPADQREWGIPQLWLANAPWLGEARSDEVYLVPGALSVRAFEGGMIYYEAASGRCSLARFVTRLA